MAILISDNTTFKWMCDGKRYLIHVQQDTCPDDPRKFNDNMTVMACWHRNYSLGDDVVGKNDPEDFWRNLVHETVSGCEALNAAMAGKLNGIRIAKNSENPELLDVYETCCSRSIFGTTPPTEELAYEAVSPGAAEECLRDDLTITHCQTVIQPYLEWLPLYLLDHSGITMSTSSFNDPWDSGQVGFIYMTKDTVMKERPEATEENWREYARSIMELDTKLYDQYLTGEVYIFTSYEEVDGEWQEIDSIGGFYGDDIMENGMAEAVGYGFAKALASGEAEEGTATIHKVTIVDF